MATNRTALARRLALPSNRRPRCRYSLVDSVRRDIQVSHRPDRMRAQHAEPDAVAPHGSGIELIPSQAGLVNVEDHDVRLHGARFELDPGNAGQLLRQLPGPLVILGQPIDVVLQGIDAGGGNDPGLPHGAPETLLVAPGLLD